MGWMSLVCVIAGSAMTLIITLLTNHQNNKAIEEAEEKRWRRDNCAEVIYDLIHLLNDIDITVIAEETFDPSKVKIDVDNLLMKQENLHNYIESNSGKIIALLDGDVYSTLFRFSSALYECTKVNTIDFKNYSESKIFETIIKAKGIIRMLKKAL